MNKLLYILIFFLSLGCTHDSSTEKHQSSRDNTINVQNRIKEIYINDVLISNISRLYLMDDYLIIGDYKPQDKLIHIFKRNTFDYITSCTYQGLGPGEITNMGYIETDDVNRRFFVTDHGKQKIFYYDLDSIFANPFYEPKEKTKINGSLFPNRYHYMNDTLSIALIIEPIGNSNFSQSVAKWNMNTGEMEFMKYQHPDITQKRVDIAVSFEKGIYIECYSSYDLMTIYDLNGDVIYNIYGPGWNKDVTKNEYYGKVQFCKEYIVVLYSGENGFIKDKNKGVKVNLPTKFVIFDINGNYIQTLETKYHISDFCYDKESNRIIMALDDDIQFAYLDLDDII